MQKNMFSFRSLERWTCFRKYLESQTDKQGDRGGILPSEIYKWELVLLSLSNLYLFCQHGLHNNKRHEETNLCCSLLQCFSVHLLLLKQLLQHLDLRLQQTSVQELWKSLLSLKYYTMLPTGFRDVPIVNNCAQWYYIV